MKIGQSVTYVGPDGTEQLVTIVDFVEHGPSFNWRLSFSEGLPDVPHEADKTEGAGYWRLGEPGKPTPPERPHRKRR